jgi:hypothetical protein
MIFLLNRKKILNPLFQTRDVVCGEGKLRDLGMVCDLGDCLKIKKLTLLGNIKFHINSVSIQL